MKVKRGQIWEVDFEPQAHRAEPGKRRRPALVLQSNILNDSGHKTTIVIPGTTKIYRDKQGDAFPLRIALTKYEGLQEDTDLLIDQVRSIANTRFLGEKPIVTLSSNHMKRVVEALNILTK